MAMVECAAAEEPVSRLPPPQVPEYRVTLFYGPEPVEGQPSRLCCVFNVKKRSWKGGVQVLVEVSETQLEMARRSTALEASLKEALGPVPEAERAGYESRASDLLAQATCALKLDLALERGLPQRNGRVGCEELVEPLNRAIVAQAGRLKARIFEGLDLPVS